MKKKLTPELFQKGTLSLKNKESQLYIAGIGASAGGLEALEQFFKNVPDNSGLTFVVIQHLDPNHIGIMPELLQRISSMKVLQATDNLNVKPNYVYVIPPKKNMSILNGVLHLFDQLETHGLRLPIDIFFRSLADDQQEKSIGIILSGMGSDGSLGLKAIKEKGGIVLVQEPISAKFDAMPHSAINSVIVDIIAPADELPGKLLSLLKLNTSVKPKIEVKIKSNIEKIIILIREKTGHDFSFYKKTTLLRRIDRRKSVHEIEKLPLYVRFLQENPSEIDILFKELLIGVTNFFRDSDVWDLLKEKVFYELLNKLPNGYLIRAWVPGCSTGEEAYSLAIVFKESLDKVKKNKNISLQIFATDIDSEAIDKARKGYFTKNILADVSEERIKRFFIVEGEGFRINAEIREMVVFAPQNVIKDPPFTKLDILTCRNLLIYIEAELQKKLMTLFKYSLIPNGILVLGSSESVGYQNEGFEEVDSKLKIYKRRRTISAPEFVDFPNSVRHPKIVKAEKVETTNAEENIQSVADQILLQRFSPASVLIKSKGDIVYITGRTGKYLEPATGKVNFNIHAMAREGLREELPGAFRKAMKSFEPVIIRNIKVGTNGGSQFVDVTIQQIEKPESVKGMIMLVFSDVSENIIVEEKNSKNKKQISRSKEKELEEALKRNNEEMQSIREEMQSSQEELKSANEELQSTNGELQFINEELTISKEEMQSLNEELQTVNIELQSKISDFIKAHDDMKNLLNSTEIATLFLDKELNIRRFTDPVTKIFKLREADIGRPFTDFVSNLEYSEIEKDTRNVIKTLTFLETAISTNDGKWFKIRIMPYRTSDDRIDGVVITFNDITVSKKLEFELKAVNEALGINKKGNQNGKE